MQQCPVLRAQDHAAPETQDVPRELAQLGEDGALEVPKRGLALVDEHRPDRLASPLFENDVGVEERPAQLVGQALAHTALAAAPRPNEGDALGTHFADHGVKLLSGVHRGNRQVQLLRRRQGLPTIPNVLHSGITPAPRLVVNATARPPASVGEPLAEPEGKGGPAGWAGWAGGTP